MRAPSRHLRRNRPRYYCRQRLRRRRGHPLSEQLVVAARLDEATLPRAEGAHAQLGQARHEGRPQDLRVLRALPEQVRQRLQGRRRQRVHDDDPERGKYAPFTLVFFRMSFCIFFYPVRFP